MVVNGSEDTLDVLRAAFEHAGFAPVTIHSRDVREHQVEFERALEAHQPRVIVYDVSFPYELHWETFKELRARSLVRQIPCVITTTNPVRLRAVAGPDLTAYEIVDKPSELNVLIRAVCDAAQIPHRTIGGT